MHQFYSTSESDSEMNDPSYEPPGTEESSVQGHVSAPSTSLGRKRTRDGTRLPPQATPLKKRIKNEEAKNYNEEEIKFYKALIDKEKEKIASLEDTIKGMNKANVPLRFKVLLSGIDNKLKAVAIQKLNYLNMLDPSHSEYYRICHWVESVCKIPFGIYKQLPVNYESDRTDVRKFLNTVRDNMNKNVYGHDTTKDHIVRLLAQWVSNPAAKGLVIGIQGPMGCGKTTLVKEGICTAFDLPFAFIPLGGANDGCFLEGHSYTYEGAVWGKIVDVLIKSECMNPVIFFDELDKVSDTSKGEEIINKLIHITDTTQNDKFTDKYFSEFEFDLSRCLIIFSYNNEENINPVLRDRMVRIKTDGYTSKDKVAISQKHMIPTLLKEYNYMPNTLVFTDTIIQKIIDQVGKEEGVRNLRRALQDIISNINLNRLLIDDGSVDEESIYDVTESDIKKYVHCLKVDKASHLMMYM